MMMPIEAFDYIVVVTGKAKLTRDEHERVKMALMALKPIVEQAESDKSNERVGTAHK